MLPSAVRPSLRFKMVSDLSRHFLQIYLETWCDFGETGLWLSPGIQPTFTWKKQVILIQPQHNFKELQSFMSSIWFLIWLRDVFLKHNLVLVHYGVEMFNITLSSWLLSRMRYNEVHTVKNIQLSDCVEMVYLHFIYGSQVLFNRRYSTLFKKISFHSQSTEVTYS